MIKKDISNLNFYRKIDERLTNLVSIKFKRSFYRKYRKFKFNKLTLELVMKSIVVTGMNLDLEDNEHKFVDGFKKIKIKNAIIKQRNLKKKISNQFKACVRKNLWNSWILQLYLIFKLKQFNKTVSNYKKKSQYKFNYFFVYSFNFNNLLFNLIKNKLKEPNIRHLSYIVMELDLKPKYVFPNTEEMRIKKSSYKFN